jgi:hypothetical protein
MGFPQDSVLPKPMFLSPSGCPIRHNWPDFSNKQSEPAEPLLAIKTINLESGMPSVEQARARLRSEVAAAQGNKLRVLKVIHGYGSHGVGGDLRFALQATLRQMAESGEIRDCIYGENWRKSDERSWGLLKRSPELKQDPDLGKGNRGISIVLL